jgi:hypothetical protein
MAIGTGIGVPDRHAVLRCLGKRVFGIGRQRARSLEQRHVGWARTSDTHQPDAAIRRDGVLDPGGYMDRASGMKPQMNIVREIVNCPLAL